MFKKGFKRFIGLLLIGYSIYDEIMLFTTKSAMDAIPDIPSADLPIFTFTFINIIIFLIGAFIIYRSKKDKNSSNNDK
ncbi:MAG: hypothetical protein PF638_07700 [Candidatus Delongbacteria bacterium]|jgi:hypothetical protein|nr:hypothetical protein [Candidatus Delongbacteria bacterium]